MLREHQRARNQARVTVPFRQQHAQVLLDSNPHVRLPGGAGIVRACFSHALSKIERQAASQGLLTTAKPSVMCVEVFSVAKQSEAALAWTRREAVSMASCDLSDRSQQSPVEWLVSALPAVLNLSGKRRGRYSASISSSSQSAARDCARVCAGL